MYYYIIYVWYNEGMRQRMIIFIITSYVYLQLNLGYVNNVFIYSYLWDVPVTAVGANGFEIKDILWLNPDKPTCK